MLLSCLGATEGMLKLPKLSNDCIGYLWVYLRVVEAT